MLLLRSPFWFAAGGAGRCRDPTGEAGGRQENETKNYSSIPTSSRREAIAHRANAGRIGRIQVGSWGNQNSALLGDYCIGPAKSHQSVTTGFELPVGRRSALRERRLNFARWR